MNNAELKGAWRAIIRAPGYALVALLVLSLGIGATTTVFAVLKVVVLNPLPYPAQHELVRINESKLPQFPSFSVAPGKFMVWERDASSFASMVMYGGASGNLTGRAEPLRLVGINATVKLFDTLRVAPALGRGFNAGDLDSSEEPLVLSHGAWMTHFGGDPAVVGSAVTLNGSSHPIIGVAPPRFDFPSPRVEFYSLWRLGAKEAQELGGHYTGVVGRLAPGRTLQEAHAELNTIAVRMEQEHPDQSTGWRVLTDTLADAWLGDASRRLYLLLGGVALVLLITCANVAGLTLVRTVARAHEFAIRRAQGATHGSIARQLLYEGALLALAGGALGAVFTALALPLIRATAPAEMPRIQALAVEPAVLWVALGVSLLAGALAAAVPAMLATRRAVAGDLRDGGRGAVGGRGRSGRNVLVAGEVALAVVLLAAATLLGRSVLELNGVDPGFQADTSVYTRIALPNRYEEAAAAQFYGQLAERAAALPGVRRAGVTQALPMVGDYVLTFGIAGRPEPADGDEPNAVYYAVTPDYLAAMGVPLLRGRGIEARDRADAQRVALVSESFAERHFPGEEVLGERIRIDSGPEDWREIVGVVADVRQYGLDARIEPQMYEPLAQTPHRSAYVVLESATPPASLTGPLREIVRQIDADQPVGELRSLASVIADSLADRRFSAWMIGGFALTALLLAAIGLYGTLAYQVRQSVREIGVRLAMGARRRDVLQMVLRQGLWLAGAGAAAGLGFALLGGQLLEAFVFGVSARDPLTLGAIVAGMLGIGVAASAIPAWRAAGVAPMEALRHE